MPTGDLSGHPPAVLLDAGVLIGALLRGDPRHREARQVVERARRGDLQAWVTAGILSEVYGALTWERAEPRHTPAEAAGAVRLLVEPPSAIGVLDEGLEVAYRALELAVRCGLTARRIHDARHAAAALVAGIGTVYTYDLADWLAFAPDGLRCTAPDGSSRRPSPSGSEGGH